MGSGGAGVKYAGANDGDENQGMDPAMANVLDTYWADYSPCLGESATSGKRKRQTTSTTTSSSSGCQRDGLRFLELIYKLSSTGHTIPREIYDRIIQLVENHSNHNHIAELSQEVRKRLCTIFFSFLSDVSSSC